MAYRVIQLLTDPPQYQVNGPEGTSFHFSELPYSARKVCDELNQLTTQRDKGYAELEVFRAMNISQFFDGETASVQIHGKTYIDLSGGVKGVYTLENGGWIVGPSFRFNPERPEMASVAIDGRHLVLTGPEGNEVRIVLPRVGDPT